MPLFIVDLYVFVVAELISDDILAVKRTPVEISNMAAILAGKPSVNDVWFYIPQNKRVWRRFICFRGR